MSNYVIFGLPGAGKGTVAEKLEEVMGIKQFSTGALLRAEVTAKSDLGVKVKKIMDEGRLVSDDIMISIIEKQLKETKQDIMFDGFPRTLEQAWALDKITTIKAVLFLKVSDEMVIKRLTSRTDSVGNKRNDDELSIIKNRIDVYYSLTKPVLDFYQEKGLLKEIDGSLSVEEVFRSCYDVINNMS